MDRVVAPLLVLLVLLVLLLLPALSGCDASVAAGARVAAAPSLAIASPDLELRDARGAVVGGKDVPFDGVAEGLAWPALRAAFPRKPGDHAPLTIAVARGIPLSAVMKAVWTLRDADLRLQTPGTRPGRRASWSSAPSPTR